MTRRHALEPRGRRETLAGGERQVRPQLDLSTARRRGEGTCLPRQRPLPTAVRNLPDTTVSEIAVKEAMMKDLEFEPGSRFSYSNIGFTLLGFVIENQTSIPYNEYLGSYKCYDKIIYINLFG